MNRHLGTQAVGDGQRKCEFWTKLIVSCLLKNAWWGGVLMEEFPKWIITCLCSEVSWHSWILQEPGLSTGEVYRIKFGLFEDSCSFDSFIYLPLWKLSPTKASLRLAVLRTTQDPVGFILKHQNSPQTSQRRDLTLREDMEC